MTAAFFTFALFRSFVLNSVAAQARLVGATIEGKLDVAKGDSFVEEIRMWDTFEYGAPTQTQSLRPVGESKKLSAWVNPTDGLIPVHGGVYGFSLIATDIPTQSDGLKVARLIFQVVDVRLAVYPIYFPLTANIYNEAEMKELLGKGTLGSGVPKASAAVTIKVQG